MIMDLSRSSPQRPLGRSGAMVPVLGFGVSGPHGGIAPPTATRRLILDCLESGFGLFDTAPFYGDAERRLGAALREWRGAQPFVVTKAGTLGRGLSLRKCFDGQSIRTSVEASRARLGVDRLGAVLLHGPPPEAAADPWLRDALVALKGDGLVQAIGVCGRGAEIAAFADAGWIDVVQAPMGAAELAVRRGIGFLAIETMRGALGSSRPIRRIEDVWYVARAIRAARSGSEAFEASPRVPSPIDSLRAALSTAGVSAVITTTVRRRHLAQNIAVARGIAE